MSVAPGDSPDEPWERTLSAAAERVDYRLTFAQTEPRHCHSFGVDGPAIPNAYRSPASPTTAAGDWDDPDFIHSWSQAGETEDAAIDRWFVTAVREAVHEALEWFRVDDQLYLNPHGDNDEVIHDLSEQFAVQLTALREARRRS